VQELEVWLVWSLSLLKIGSTSISVSYYLLPVSLCQSWYFLNKFAIPAWIKGWFRKSESDKEEAFEEYEDEEEEEIVDVDEEDEEDEEESEPKKERLLNI